MADNSELNDKLGLSIENFGDEDTAINHTIDPTLVNPSDTEASEIGFKGIGGILNVEYDPESTGGEGTDDDLDISVINGMLFSKYEDPDPEPFPPSERGMWIKHILASLNTKEYRVWYLKSHDKHCIPFDTCRGFMYWDFDREMLFYIEANKYDAYTAQKFPIVINTVGFDSILHIEGYYNLKDKKN